MQKAIKDRGGLSKIRCLAARRKPNIEIGVVITNDKDETVWSYNIGIKQKSGGYNPPILVYEEVKKNNVVVLNRPQAEDKSDPERLLQTHLEQINSNKEFRELNTFFDKVLYLHLIPQLLKHPETFTGPDLPGDPFGKGFLDRISRINARTRNSWLKKIQEGLAIAVPQFKSLHYVEDKGKPHIEAIYEHWRKDGAKQREDQFSDGTLRLIGLFWALLEGDGLLLLEEPELSLNGAIVSKMPALIYKLQKHKKRQVILTSHSIELLQDRGISLEEIVILEPSGEGTHVSLASSKEEIKNMLEGGMTPGDIILPQTKPKDIDQLSIDF